MDSQDSKIKKLHPEQKDDEFFLGNFNESSYQNAIGWTGKRKGIVAYYAAGEKKGEPIPQQVSLFNHHMRLFPAFVKADNVSPRAYELLMKSHEEGSLV